MKKNAADIPDTVRWILDQVGLKYSLLKAYLVLCQDHQYLMDDTKLALRGRA
jgi:hypothetical protein